MDAALNRRYICSLVPTHVFCPGICLALGRNAYLRRSGDHDYLDPSDHAHATCSSDSWNLDACGGNNDTHVKRGRLATTARNLAYAIGTRVFRGRHDVDAESGRR